ncbi:MAG: DUF1800 domain-containing protein [Actinomycetota bacterium]|nr:DUF1800 domain-containing protein [Actinomycetota bacterium]
MDPVQLAHLLRRTEYVAKPARMAALSPVSVTRENAVDDILNVPAAVPLPTYLDHDIDGEGYHQWVYAVQWWLDRMTDTEKPMHEKMTWFWHGLFCSSWNKVNSAWAMMQQNKLFRDSAFGNFRTLTHAMSIQPAMLFYLDNLDNVKTSPNQNFARELMELFTIGVVDQDGNPNYTEDDVTAAARAWTGHGIDWNTYLYKFWTGDHDYGLKTFMGVERNWNGPDIINYLLQENTAKKLQACKFLTKKLWEFLAYQNPSQALIDELAQVLYTNDMNIKPWVKALLMHDDFYTPEAMQGLVKSPVDYVVALQYFTGYRGDDLNPQWYMDAMGQEPYGPPNVAGWKTNAYWVNTSLFGARAEFARDATWHLRNNDGNAVGKGRTPQEAVDFTAAMFGVQLATPTNDALVDFINVQRAEEPWIGWWESTNLLTMTMMTPEFHVA